MIKDRALAAGTRVRLRAPSPHVELRSSLGHIVRPDQWDGYYIVRLERPARYRGPDGKIEILREIREAADNMDIVNSGTELFLSDARGVIAQTSATVVTAACTVFGRLTPWR